ncbi:DUF2147 domain-containing protein [Jhaorihella thermophila]|uniref:Uncharacterized protein n=1 Tax=Jhaorihella thermophila TaxID=488547 RepID=A0A1H5RVM0_9RHOB|nr:DUF2147 domain-containing protein [Jhaorihella thermophila]SEF42379.1 hypothetical protein SAMN05421751_101191 [Jhaorihella thermophila]
MTGRTLSGLVAIAAMTATAATADIYIRNGEEQVEVSERGGLLYCTRLSDGYEMCNGMKKADDGSWRGKKMKHPDMPRWMSFNGTVTFSERGLRIKGCTLGICDSETWSRQN